MTPTNDSMTEAFWAYLTDERGSSPKTLEAYRGSVSKFLGWLEGEHGAVSLRDVTTAHVRGYVDWLLEKGGRDGGPATRSTVRARVAALNSLFSFLVSEGHVETNHCKRVRLPRLNEAPPRFLTPAEAKALLKACNPTEDWRGARDHAMITLMMMTGLRRAEVTSLDLDDIDITLGDDSYVDVRAGKGDRRRQNALNKTARAALRRWLKKRPAGAPTSRLFISARHRPISEGGFGDIMEARSEAAGIKDKMGRGSHILRHTCATRLSENGASMPVIRDTLGHASITTTSRYTHASKNSLKEAVRSIG